ncbi:MAG: hypothetical protein U9N77_03490, partial [Thermodesulfobacteriota bacterium]|nr:hypothetical protein [Thermodesulfobacteriota bacterium]
EVKEIFNRVKSQIMYRLNNLNKVQLNKEFRIKTECPSELLPDKVKRAKIEVIALKLALAEGTPTLEQKNTAILFGVQKELEKHGLCLKIIRSNIAVFNTCEQTATFSCPRIPKDTDAKIGVRRDPQNAKKKQKIFGCNAVISTSVELDLKLELPVAVTNIAGNGDEGSMLIVNKEQIKPNGFDSKNQCHTFCCFKQCLKMKVPGINNLQKNYDIGACPYIENRNGYSKHMYIKHQPRMQNEIPRGTKRYNDLKQSRSASERANSTIKEDVKVIDKPIVYNKSRADIIVQIAAIALLMHRSMAFIVKSTIFFLKHSVFNTHETMNKTIRPKTPTSTRSQIQLE